MRAPVPASSGLRPIPWRHRRWRLAAITVVFMAGTALTAGTVTAHAGVSTASNGLDGVAQIYPTKPGGQTWFMDDNPDSDPRFDPGDISRNSDGSWRSESGKVRMGVRTTSYTGDESDLVWRQDELETRGYMFDADDWRDVEMTGYVRLNDASDDGEEFTWYARGARHTGDDSPPEACWGSAYKGSIAYTSGEARFDKEVYHVGYGFLPWRGDFGSIEDKWIGFKVVMYNLPGGSVKLESYADLDNNNEWVKVYDYTDDGGWSIEDSYPDNPCGGPNDQIITWGGPIATFRWDDANSVDFTKFSVREIDATGTAPSPSPTPTQSPTPPPGGGEDLPVTAVTASEDDGNVPGNTRDGDFSTRWSAEAVNRSEWIRYDLGGPAAVNQVRVAWHRGDERRTSYRIEVSGDGANWQAVRSGQSSGTTTGFEAYDIPDTTARFVRIVGDGNTDNDWVSITEVKIIGAGAGTGTKDLPASWVDASSDDGNVPQNTRDGDLATRWSAYGDGEWIRYDLGESDESIHHIKIAWYQGDQRRADFDVEASTDGLLWDTLLAGRQSSGSTTALETYDFPDTASKYRYVRVVGHGNTDNNWNSISEVRIFGCCSSEGNGTNGRLVTDYDHIESLLWSIFDVRNGEPNNVDASHDADIDNYYATVFLKRTSDGREHELVRYRPKAGGETYWGWTYERYRDGPDRYHQAHKWLVKGASYPPGASEVQQEEELDFDSYHGRIWCWYGRDMVMVTNQLIMATAGLYGKDIEGVSSVLLDLTQEGVELVVEHAYYGQLPEHDYCTENGYIS